MSPVQAQILNDLAGHLYAFLPGSGNNNFSFPIAAAKVGVAEFWVGGSKRPAILHLLEGTLNAQRHRFCPLILAVVKHSMPWRAGRGDPLTIDEIDQLNALLLRLQFKIPELHEPAFRDALAGKPKPPPTTKPNNDPAAIDALARDLIAISNLEPTPRGFAFEKFLTEAFALFGLAPRGSFRLTGEQIDGSFQLDGATFCWKPSGKAPRSAIAICKRSPAPCIPSLLGPAAFLSATRASPRTELEAFARGNATHIICMKGEELWQVMDGKLDLAEVLTRKTRRAAETGQAFVELRTLYQI